VKSHAPTFLRHLTKHWPLIMAALFSAVTLLLLWFLSSSETQLRRDAEARHAADVGRRAAAIADFIGERRQAAADLAAVQEIDHYLVNRSLGMSPRYGLNATLSFVEQRFRQQLKQKTLRGAPVYDQILFLDNDGRRLVDVGVSADDMSLPDPSDNPNVRVDTARSLVVASAPVAHKGERSGQVVTVTDIRVLTRLIAGGVEATDRAAGDHEFLVTSGGIPIVADVRWQMPIKRLDAFLAEAPEGQFVEATRYSGGEPLAGAALLRTPVPGLPLSIVTLVPEAEARGQILSSAYAFYLGGFTVVLMLSALGFERLRRRTQKLEQDYSASDRHRAELAQRNEALSNEISRRRAVEAVLCEKTATLDRLNADLRIAAAAFDCQEGMLVADTDHLILRVNRAFVRMTGYEPGDIVGRPMRLAGAEQGDSAFEHEAWDSVRRTGGWQGEIEDRTRTGETYSRWLTISSVKDYAGAVTHFIGTYYDVSERKKAEERIRELAFFDQLTGLPNRALLRDRMKQVISANARYGTFGALLFIDLDNFKTLNDTLGHGVGDDVLKEVARRLKSCVRGVDTVARLGGDEFVVLLAEMSTQQKEAAIDAKKVGEKILAALNRTYRLDNYEHLSTPSIGIALIAGRSDSVDELLKRADLAMYEAKATGRNTLRFFDPLMQTVVNSRAALEADIRDALKKSQFELHFQPQVGRDGCLTGAEALLRWPHPKRGLVPPSEFIPVAESTGLIRPLGQWVMEAACRQLASWARRPETAHLTLAVNVSALQFHHKDFVDQVNYALDAAQADPGRLELELTESLLVRNIEDVIAKMMTLKERGIRFSLDDFGTGYSSLAYLKRMPLDQLKIDRSFVRDILVDPNDAAIAKMVILLGASLGLTVIAEGVETDDQRHFLAHQGCHAYQGYLFGRPMPVGEFNVVAGTAQARERRSGGISAVLAAAG
jgi:diguanylate cyclase (GGDEF)-like protein/PAS domain S-box-containing protein